MREKLIELLSDAEREHLNYEMANKFCPFDGYKCHSEYIADYLLENGVVVPLLQTGQIVYRVSKGRMWEVKIWKIEICGKTISYIDNYDKSFLFNHIGKGVFLTREDAERALKGGAE